MGRIGLFYRVSLAVLALTTFTGSIAMATTINQLNASGSITAGTNTVTIMLNNNLSNAQVLSVGANISAIYFTVTGYSGSGAVLSSSSGLTTTISKLAAPVGGFGTLGSIGPT